MVTGNRPHIWRITSAGRAQAVRRVCELLEQTYGRPRFGNPTNPIDDLVYIVLSNRTSPETAQSVYERLKVLLGKWETMPKIHVAVVQRALQPAGLSKVKAKQLRAAIAMIVRDFGGCDLRKMRKWPEADIEKYLVGLPGVSEKVAKCVMMYTLGCSVLPVDTHVHRITSRLGWTKKRRADQCHRELEALVPSHRRYAFHVDCIAHGRSVCRPTNPACDECCINGYCEFYRGRS